MEQKGEKWLSLALRSKNPREKLEYCAKFLEKNPNDTDVWHYKGDILSEYLGRDKEAIECYKKAAELIDDSSYLLAQFKYASAEYEEALKQFDDTLRKNPHYARALFGKAKTLIRLRRSEEAIVCLDRALRIGLSKVNESRALYEKGYALADLEKPEKAIECVSNSLEIDQGNAEAWCLKGLLCDKFKKYEEALVCFNNALGILEDNMSSSIAEIARNGKEMVEQRLVE